MLSSKSESGASAAISLLGAAIIVASVLPMVGAADPTGAWIIPHDHQMEAVGGSLSSSFYVGSNSNAWLTDSFFVDSLPGSAIARVDLYNPTSTDFSSVQLFVAVSDIALLSSVHFSGGDGGDVSVPSSDIGGGTPFLADGTTLEGHGVYPAFFTSYSVGSLSAGTGGIVSLWVNATGDFAAGLVLHLDYAAVDAEGNVVTGPFDADMAIFENGEASPEPTGDVRSSSFWQVQMDKASKGRANSEFNATEFDALLQAVSSQSDMFIYGQWNGTTPGGAADEGWLDIDSLADALAVMKGKTRDSNKVHNIEKEALALWLNVANGAVNLDTEVVLNETCDDSDSDDSDEGCDSHDLGELPADLDTVGEILAFAQSQSNDWKDGSGASKADLKLGRLLCRAVNNGWLVPA